ncbi:BT_3928 family protein [Tunicatimonas pelagia]|uniref:BT_3928 family protein n=1 Tax=Tunicatimonas pelagia TaxID=931531 RepID=UPI002666F98A|nr:BT_3928 family protein [Tunicatimonas pelagia]WKN41730.1 DoxX family protein [Tunicatimonas pelagia]
MVKHIARILVGGLFIFSGLVKLNDPVGTAIKLEEYFEVFAVDFASFFSAFVPLALGLSVFLSVLEVALGVAVLINYRMKITTWVLLGLIVFFTFLTFYSAFFNKVTDCGCFGDFIKLTPWESFTKDIILLVLILILFVNRNRFNEVFSLKASHLTVAITAVVCTFLGIYAIRHLPYFDFRAYYVGANIPQLMQPSEALRYKYIMEKDGETAEFTEYPTEGGYEFKEMVLLNPEAQPKITDYSVWNDEGEFTQGTFEENKLAIVMYDVNKANQEAIAEIQQLIATLPDNVEPIILTASGEEVYSEFLATHPDFTTPHYYADATVLKTIIRANPGIVLLSDGVVQGKWHYNDTPSVDDLQ